MKSKLSGSVIDFNASFSVKLKDEIGSGSFSYVYSTSDPHYVVKMINSSDPKSLASYKNEKIAFQSMPRHENLVYCPAYKDSVYIKGINYCCLALENCSKGSVIGMIVDKRVVFKEHQIFKILFDVTLGLHEMHSLSRPIAHRDLKGENVLLGDDGHFKLTDFGSISTRRIERVTQENRDDIQEDLDLNTTPTIRAPEQCDLYSGFPITEKVDIWGLGCLLYILCFHKQPFETRLSTINCQYFMPENSQYSKTLTNLLKVLFKINPNERPGTTDLLKYFEKQMHSTINNLASSIEEANEHADHYDRVRGYKTSSGVHQTYSPPDKMSDGRSRNQAKESLRLQYVNSDESKVKPLFKDVIHKFVAKLSTKTEAWMLSALEENQKGPSQQNVQFLIVKAWNKPHKIEKFYNLFYKKYQRNPDSTIIVLKGLITLHNYFRKGPNDVFLTKGPPSGRIIVNSISQAWKIIFAQNLYSSKDMIRNTYTTQLIVEYSDLLLRKFDLHLKYHRVFQGNYALEPYFLFPVEENSPISPHVIESLLDFLSQLTTFHQMLFQDQNLFQIQCSIASSILDEEYCLISALAHILAAFKQATNYIQTANIAASIEKRVQSTEERFQHCYEKASQFFEVCRQMPEFQHHRGTIPRLSMDVLKEIHEILILMNYSNQKFQAKKYLNHSRSICNLVLPRSYQEVVMNLNSHYIQRSHPHSRMRGSGEHVSHLSNQHSYHDDRDFSFAENQPPNYGHIREERREHREVRHHPVRGKNHSLSNIDSKEKEPVQKVQRDFNPNFEAYNLNRQPSIGSSNSKGLYAGFNFDNVPGQNEQLSSQEQQNNNAIQDPSQYFVDLNEGETRPEDFALVFSHQLVNTSFMKPNEVQGKNEQRPPNSDRSANPNPNPEIKIAEQSLSNRGGPPQNNNLLNIPKPSIHKSNSDQYATSAHRRSPVGPLDNQLQVNKEPTLNIAALNTNMQSTQSVYNSVPVQAQVQPINMNNSTPKGNGVQIDLLTGSVLLPSNRPTSLPKSNIPNNPNVNQGINLQQPPFQNQPVYSGQQNFQGQQPYPYGQPMNNMQGQQMQGQNMQNFNIAPNSAKNNMMNSNPAMMGNFGQQNQNMQNMQPNRNPQAYQFPGAVNNPFGQNNMMPNMQVQANQNQYNQQNPNMIQQRPQNQMQGNYNQPPMNANPQMVQNPNMMQNIPVQQIPVPQGNQGQPSPPKKENYVDQLTEAFKPKEEVPVEEPPKLEPGMDELDFLFSKNEKFPEEEKKEEVKQEPVAQNTAGFGNPVQMQMQIPMQVQAQAQVQPQVSMSSKGEWDGVFNINQNAQIQKQMEQEKERQKKQEEEAQRARQASLSLANTDKITSSHLQKFIFQEISKNANDWIIDYKQLKFLSQIGSGGSAEVYRGLWRGTDVAIKKMKLNNLPESRKKEFEREISALMKLRPHQNLVNFMGVSINYNELCVIMEFCYGGTLFEWLHVKKNVQITMRQKLKMAIDVACGLNYLHTSNPPIIHRDMKSLNLLVDGPIERNSQRFVVKLADFGLAKPQELTQEKMTGIMGTYHWMAPEIFENKDYTIKADVYSFAVVLWEIIARETPYPNLRNPAAIMKFVTMEKGRPDLSKIPNNCPKQLIDLMIQCWDEDPNKRPHLSEALERLKELENWQLE